jgi:hypothetical protein
LLLGLISTVFVYLGPAYESGPIGFTQNTTGLCALVLLSISAIGGLKRVEYDIAVKKNNFSHLYMGELRVGIVKALHTEEAKVNIQSGEIFHPRKAELESAYIEDQMPKVEIEMSKLQKQIEIAYKTWSWAPILGFLLPEVSKISNLYHVS